MGTRGGFHAVCMCVGALPYCRESILTWNRDHSNLVSEIFSMHHHPSFWFCPTYCLTFRVFCYACVCVWLGAARKCSTSSCLRVQLGEAVEAWSSHFAHACAGPTGRFLGGYSLVLLLFLIPRGRFLDGCAAVQLTVQRRSRPENVLS